MGKAGVFYLMRDEDVPGLTPKAAREAPGINDAEFVNTAEASAQWR